VTQKTLVAIAQLPPPVTGLAAVSEEIVNRFEARGLLLAKCNIGPPARSRGPLKFVARAVRAAKSMVSLLLWRSRGAKALYMPTDSRLGLALNIAIATLANCLGYRIIFHHHNFSYIDEYSLLMDKLIASAPGAVHVMLCPNMRKDFEARYHLSWRKARSKAVMIPNAFMSSPTKFEEKPDTLTIGHLSNLSMEKGALRFIALFRRLRGAGLQLNAELAGPCSDPAIQMAIQSTSNEYPGEFVWRGPVYNQDKEEFYRRVHAFIFPTSYRNEAQPLVLLEALSHGAVVLATSVGCIECDHRASPGEIFKNELFDDAAFQWLLEAQRDRFREEYHLEAISSFSAQHAESLRALNNFIDEVSKY
jgi:glycosyltransferase involved in cell wall biosynthesis